MQKGKTMEVLKKMVIVKLQCNRKTKKPPNLVYEKFLQKFPAKIPARCLQKRKKKITIFNPVNILASTSSRKSPKLFCKSS